MGRPKLPYIHGERKSYSNGCRCDLCREANTIKMKEDRSNRFEKGTFEHGTMVGYLNADCRCDDCKMARRGDNYGLTGAEVKHLLQDATCAVCDSTVNLVIDHDHGTDKVRGIICHKCNTALGLAGDNIQGIKRLLSYLEEHERLV